MGHTCDFEHVIVLSGIQVAEADDDRLMCSMAAADRTRAVRMHAHADEMMCSVENVLSGRNVVVQVRQRVDGVPQSRT